MADASSILERLYGTQRQAQTLPQRPTTNNGNPGGVYNQARGPVNRGGQHEALGRYRPPTMTDSGQWREDQGGFSYNLPNAYGPFRGMNDHYGTGGFGNMRPGIDPSILQGLATSGSMWNTGNAGSSMFNNFMQSMGNRFGGGGGMGPPAPGGGAAGAIDAERMARAGLGNPNSGGAEGYIDDFMAMQDLGGADRFGGISDQMASGNPVSNGPSQEQILRMRDMLRGLGLPNKGPAPVITKPDTLPTTGKPAAPIFPGSPDPGLGSHLQPSRDPRDMRGFRAGQRGLIDRSLLGGG